MIRCGWLLRCAPALLLALTTACSGARPPAPGRLVDVGGFALHIHCIGESAPGVPTVILESGLGEPNLKMHWVQTGVAGHAHVCGYDRAGIGWSEDSEQPHDPEHIARQLHALLRKAEVPGPYVLAAHSFGGLVLPVYANAYPDDVAGLLFLDSSHPRMLDESTQSVQRNFLRALTVAKYAARLGLLRLYNPLVGAANYADLPEPVYAQLRSFASEPRSYETARSEFAGLPEASRQALAVWDLGDTPTIVVTAAKGLSEPLEQSPKFRQHLDIAGLSSRGEHVLLPDATHATLLTRREDAEQVVLLIRRLLESLQRPDASGPSTP